MARFSFGSAQDLSSIFADLYRLGDQQAQRERNAADENVINQWETGEMSDADFYKYAEQRIRESSDPEERSQWEVILRNARQENESESISDTAEDIMDGIESGTRTWDDLLNFYKAERRKLKPSDPLYRQISQQIDQVEDRVRDNQVSATLGSIDYRFRSGQINAAQAQKELAALAERYKTNDPQKYYQLLSQGLDYKQSEEKAAAAAARSARGRASGENDGLKDIINDLEGWESRLISLADQAKDGQRFGTMTVPTEDGGITTETVELLTKDGRPTAELRALHGQTLEMYDELERAQLALGTGEGRDAAGETAQRKATFITDTVQPTNTISKERQWSGLVDSFVSTVRNSAANPANPASWRDIVRDVERMARWEARLNTRTTSTDVEKRASDEKVRENPELAAAVRRQTTAEETDALRRLTPDFTADVSAQIAALVSAVQSKDPQAIADALGELPEGSPLRNVGIDLAAIQRVQRGLADETFRFVMHPTQGIIPAEVEVGPLGNIAAIYDGYGQKVFEIGPNETPSTIYTQINGQDALVLGVSASTDVLTSGALIYDRATDTVRVAASLAEAREAEAAGAVVVRRGEPVPAEVAEAVKALPKGTPVPEVGPMQVMSTPDGTWFGIEQADGSTGWSKGKVPKNASTPLIPLPYTGQPEVAQRAFERGIRNAQGDLIFQDTSGRLVLDNAVATGNRVSMRAFDRFASTFERDAEGKVIPGTGTRSANANIQRATADTGFQQPNLATPRRIDPGARLGSGSYRSPSQTGDPLARSRGAVRKPTISLAQTLAAARGGDDDPLAGIRRMGQSLGLRGLGVQGPRNIDMPRVNIRRPSIRPVSVRRPNVDVAGLRAMASRLRGAAATRRTFSVSTNTQLQDARNRGSGGFV